MKVAEGIAIISKYQKNEECYAQHDTLYYGSYSKTYKLMNKEERKQMDDLGWFEDKESDSWQVFI